MQIYGKDIGRKYPLDKVQSTIGRGPDSTIVCDMDNVSRTHCKIYGGASGHYIEDMGSTNGTYVAGTRISSERRLDGAPDVRFGGMKMRFTAAGEAVVDGPEVKGTRAIASVERPRRAASAPAAASPSPVSSGSGRVSVLTWIVVAVVVAAGAFWMMQVRS